MGKAVISSILAIIVGYFGSGIGDAVMNWPQLGPILAVVVMCKFRPLSHTCTDIQPRCHGISATPSRSGATVVRGAVRPL